MFPYIEWFGIKWYMTGIGIVLAGIIFILTVYRLCKKYNQDFLKFFNWLPILLLSIYFLGLYSTFVLETGGILPGISAFSPYGYHFGFLGILIGCFFSIIVFLSAFRRNENKKIWMDIFFFGFINAVIALGIFLTLGDNFIGKECNSRVCVHALTPNSNLVKFEKVYPIGFFLSLGALIINILITGWKMSSKKNGLGVLGFILLLGLFLLLSPFWNYPAHGILNLGIVRLDINHMSVIIIMLWLFILHRKRKKPF